MKITVRTIIEVENGPEPQPKALAWDSTSRHGDNPRFYGDSLRRAVEGAHSAVLESIASLMDYRLPGRVRQDPAPHRPAGESADVPTGDAK